VNVKSARSVSGKRSSPPGQGKQQVSIVAVVIALAVLVVGLFFMYRKYTAPPPVTEVQDNDATRPPDRDPDDTAPGGGGVMGDREPGARGETSLVPPRERVALSRASSPVARQGWG